MEVQRVKTLSDFLIWGGNFSSAVRAAKPREKTPDWAYRIEIYLRSIWQLALKHRDRPLTWTLFAQILSDAQFTLPGDFNPAWIRRTHCPNLAKGGDEFEYVGQMIAHLIAELRHAQILIIADDVSSRKALSEFTEYEWKNPGLGLYLSCAFRYFDLIKDPDTIPCDWEAMGFFLMVGRNYE
jgi:hypothetical protein